MQNIAWRGTSAYEPENTLHAFETAKPRIDSLLVTSTT